MRNNHNKLLGLEYALTTSWMTLILLIALILTSCETEKMQIVHISATFAWNEVCGPYDTMELDIDGQTYSLSPEYVEIGLMANLVLPEGEKTITDARLYDKNGNLTYYVKGWETDDEMAVVRLPYSFENVLVLQFWCNDSF